MILTFYPNYNTGDNSYDPVETNVTCKSIKILGSGEGTNNTLKCYILYVNGQEYFVDTFTREITFDNEITVVRVKLAGVYEYNNGNFYVYDSQFYTLSFK